MTRRGDPLRGPHADRALRGALSGVRPDDLAASRLRRPLSGQGSTAARSTTSTSAVRTRRARTTATSRAWRRSSPGCRIPSRGDAQPTVCVRAVGRGLRVPRRDRRRRGGGRRRRGRVDEPRAVRHGEARYGVSARRPDRLGHDARLALPQPAARGDVPARVDGRDGRERRRALERLARGSGCVRAALAATLGGRQRSGSVRRRARPGRRLSAPTSIRGRRRAPRRSRVSGRRSDPTAQ